MENSLNWNDLKYFIAVARHGSLSGASRQLGVSTSTALRRVSVLEGALKRKLFHRHHDGYVLSSAGRDLLGMAENTQALFQTLEQSATTENENLSGVVRIDAPEMLGQQVLVPNLNRLTRTNPRVQLIIRSSVQPVQLSHQEPDIVLRLVRPERGNYKMRTIGKVSFGFYASQSYIREFGAPVGEQDLPSHRVIGWSDELRYLTMATWLEEVCPRITPSMQLNSLAAQISAVRAGLGVAVLPCFSATRENLVPVMSHIPPLTMNLWLLLQGQSGELPAVKLVKECIIEILSENAADLTGSL